MFTRSIRTRHNLKPPQSAFSFAYSFTVSHTTLTTPSANQGTTTHPAEQHLARLNVGQGAFELSLSCVRASLILPLNQVKQLLHARFEALRKK